MSPVLTIKTDSAQTSNWWRSGRSPTTDSQTTDHLSKIEICRSEIKQIRAVQERIIREIPDCYPGPDYDSFAPDDRADGIHLGMSGLERAAQLRENAVSPAFLKKAKPYIPKP